MMRGPREGILWLWKEHHCHDGLTRYGSEERGGERQRTLVCAPGGGRCWSLGWAWEDERQLCFTAGQMSTVQGTATQLPGARQQWEMGPGAQRSGPGTDGDLSITVSWVGALVQRDWL